MITLFENIHYTSAVQPRSSVGYQHQKIMEERIYFDFRVTTRPWHGKRAEHRVEWLYTPAILNNAPIDFIFGVDKL